MAEAGVRPRARRWYRRRSRDNGPIGFEGRYDYGALGPVTSLAARLSDEAVGGQILVSQRAYAALEEYVEANLIGDIRIKGFSRPNKVYELMNLR